MISHKYKFIYIHIPKTGGNSIQSALVEYSDDRLVFRESIGNVVGEDGFQGLDVFNDKIGFGRPVHKHATIQDYYAKLGDEIFSYFIFASVRNPWDRVVSQTAFLSKSPLPKRALSVADFSFPSPMIDYITLNGSVPAIQFIRFENLKDDFDFVCKKIGLPILPLPHKNKSSREGYRIYYSSSTANFIRLKFSSDIEAFSYKF